MFEEVSHKGGDTLIFNGIEKDYLVPLTGRRRSAWAPISRILVTAPGMAGAYLSRTETQIREIVVPVIINAENIEDLQKIKEDMAEWLVHDEPKELIFKDEPDRVYYAVVDGELELDEIFSTGRGEITFICPDPYKYGPEKVVEPTSDEFIIENDGTAEAKPIIELTATEKATFAMVSNGIEEYNIIGTPSDDDVVVVDEKTSVLYENGSTIDEWQTATLEMLDTYHIDAIGGQMTTDGAGIRADGYGTGQKLHGPAVFKELNNPIQDFELVTTFDIISQREVDHFRMGIMLHDVNMNNIGHLGIKDDSRIYKRRVPLGRVGPWGGEKRDVRNVIGDADRVDGVTDTTLFYLRMSRVGNTFEFYIGEWRNQRHIRKWSGTYRDIDNEYTNPLRYVTIYITNYADRLQPLRLRITNVELFEINKAEVDQTPYIIYPGEVVTFDHVTKDILLNGESRKDLKAFGGSFFTLKKGINTLTVTPENTFNTKITYRERYK